MKERKWIHYLIKAHVARLKSRLEAAEDEDEIADLDNDITYLKALALKWGEGQ